MPNQMMNNMGQQPAPSQGPPPQPIDQGQTPSQDQQAQPPPSENGGSKEEDQKQFDMFMSYAMLTLHDQKVSPGIAKSLSGMKNDIHKVIDFIAQTTVGIVERVENSAANKKIVISDNVKLMAANQIMGEVINMAKIVGVKELSKEEKAQAFSLCTSMYLSQQVKSGKMTPQQVQEMSQKLQQTPQGKKIVQTRADILNQAKQRGFKQKTIPGGVSPSARQQPPGQGPPVNQGGLIAPSGGGGGV